MIPLEGGNFFCQIKFSLENKRTYWNLLILFLNNLDIFKRKSVQCHWSSPSFETTIWYHLIPSATYISLHFLTCFFSHPGLLGKVNEWWCQMDFMYAVYLFSDLLLDKSRLQFWKCKKISQNWQKSTLCRTR